MIKKKSESAEPKKKAGQTRKGRIAGPGHTKCGLPRKEKKLESAIKVRASIRRQDVDWGIEEQALKYFDLNLSVIPVKFRGKKPVLGTGWQNARLSRAEISRHFGSRPQNIGVLLGAPSGIIDIDLDCQEAIALAPSYLPATATFGHGVRKASHYIYSIAGEPPASRNGIDPSDEKIAVEMRSSGRQTVFPGSVHQSGERIVWDGPIRFTKVAGEALVEAFDRLLAAVIVARN